MVAEFIAISGPRHGQSAESICQTRRCVERDSLSPQRESAGVRGVNNSRGAKCRCSVSHQLDGNPSERPAGRRDAHQCVRDARRSPPFAFKSACAKLKNGEGKTETGEETVEAAC